MTRAVVLVVAAACWTTAARPPPAEPQPIVQTAVGPRHTLALTPCEWAVDHAFELLHDSLVNNIPDNELKLPALRKVAAESCVETAWSDEALQCITGADTADDINRCEATLTSEQTQDVIKRMSVVMTTP